MTDDNKVNQLVVAITEFSSIFSYANAPWFRQKHSFSMFSTKIVKIYASITDI